MTPGIKPLVAGNWKMNGLKDSLNELSLIANGHDADMQGRLDMLVCVPATLVSAAADRCSETGIGIGGQDCHFNASGAHTGDISAGMIADAGGTAVIVGHSERRSDHNENSALVRAKAKAAIQAGLLAIICIGETEEERKSGVTLDILKEQLENSLPEAFSSTNAIVAYEPVWAIGTGLTPTAGDVAEVHQFVRSFLQDHHGENGSNARILYGGSVKPGNAAELMNIENVDGALVGGASLKAEDFLGICSAYSKIS